MVFLPGQTTIEIDGDTFSITPEVTPGYFFLTGSVPRTSPWAEGTINRQVQQYGVDPQGYVDCSGAIVGQIQDGIFREIPLRP